MLLSSIQFNIKFDGFTIKIKLNITKLYLIIIMPYVNVFSNFDQLYFESLYSVHIKLKIKILNVFKLFTYVKTMKISWHTCFHDNFNFTNSDNWKTFMRCLL